MRPPSEVWPEKWRYLRRITRAQLTWRLKQINEINNYPSAAVLLRPLYAIRSDRQMSPARPRDHRRIPPPCGHGAGVITTVVAAAAVEGAPPTYPSYPSPRTLFQGSHSHGRSPVGGGGAPCARHQVGPTNRAATNSYQTCSDVYAAEEKTTTKCENCRRPR